jgi:tetratricopeptide (TPR) repeat protein
VRHPNYQEAAGEIFWLIRAGDWRQAERLLARLRAKGNVCGAYLTAIEGELAVAKGELKAGIALLQDTPPLVNPAADQVHFLAAESLAGALEKTGQMSSAISVLEKASLLKPHAYWTSGFLWLRIRFQLAQMYRRVGQNEQAMSIETELRRLLKYADADHPLAKALRRPQP